MISYAYIINIASEEKQLINIKKYRPDIESNNIIIDKTYLRNNHVKLKEAIKTSFRTIKQLGSDAKIELILTDLSTLTVEDIVFFREYDVVFRVLSIPSTLKGDSSQLFEEMFIEFKYLEKHKYSK